MTDIAYFVGFIVVGLLCGSAVTALWMGVFFSKTHTPTPPELANEYPDFDEDEERDA